MRPIRRDLRALLLLAAFSCAVLAPRIASARTEPSTPVAVIVPEPENLQLLAFWVALGAGYFSEEGLDLQVVSPEKPAQAESLFQGGADPLAVLPGPSYERLIAARFPFLVTANLLTNDPLDLIVRREFATRAHLSRGMTLRRRLDLIQGISIGVSPQARPRLNVLFRSQGLDVNNVRVVVLRGDEQIAALEAKQVDALYTESPYLEKAMLDEDMVMEIDQAGGEVPRFAERMIEALVMTRAFADAHPRAAAGLARAVGKAEHLIRFERGSAEGAVLKALPQADRRLLSYLISLYAAAIPATPHVEESLVKREATFYPVGGDVLKLEGINLRDFIFDDGGPSSIGMGVVPAGAEGQGSGGSLPRRVMLLGCLLGLAIALIAVVADQRDRANGAR